MCAMLSRKGCAPRRGRVSSPLPLIVKKQDVIQKILDHLSDELDLYTRAARAAFAEATDEQSRSENKYDTRGLEASYLARGQARQVAEVEESLRQFKALGARVFGPHDAAAVGALVELEGRGGRAFYLLGPRAGGTEVVVDGHEVLVLTPESPLGAQLMGRCAGERIKITLAGVRQDHRVASIS